MNTRLLLMLVSGLAFALVARSVTAGGLVKVNYGSYGLPSRTLEDLANRFDMHQKDSYDLVLDTRRVDGWGEARFQNDFVSVDKVVWQRVSTDAKSWVLWPPYVVRTTSSPVPTPLRQFKLTKLEHVLADAKPLIMEQIRTANDYGKVDYILNALHYLFQSNDELCKRLDIPWRVYLCRTTAEMIDAAKESPLLRPESGLTSPDHIHRLMYVSGWSRWGATVWVGTERLSPKEEQRYLADMLARTVDFASSCYLPGHYGRNRNSGWPGRKLKDALEDLDVELQPLFRTDAAFLYEKLLNNTSGAILEQMVTDSTTVTAMEKAEWKRIRDGVPGSSPPTLFNTDDVSLQTRDNMNLAALERLVDLTNKAARHLR